MDKIFSYIDANQDFYIKRLADAVAIEVGLEGWKVV